MWSAVYVSICHSRAGRLSDCVYTPRYDTLRTGRYKLNTFWPQRYSGVMLMHRYKPDTSLFSVPYIFSQKLGCIDIQISVHVTFPCEIVVVPDLFDFFPFCASNHWLSSFVGHSKKYVARTSWVALNAVWAVVCRVIPLGAHCTDSNICNPMTS